MKAGYARCKGEADESCKMLQKEINKKLDEITSMKNLPKENRGSLHHEGIAELKDDILQLRRGIAEFLIHLLSKIFILCRKQSNYYAVEK